METRKYIIYNVPDLGESRKMLVIDGQPFYQSTGKNSGAKGVWFPFTMIRGSKPMHYANLPEIYNKKSFRGVVAKEQADYILKFDMPLLSGLCKRLDANIHNGRIATKDTLIISAQLSGYEALAHFFTEINASEEDIKLAKSPISITENAEFESKDPEKINKWLIEQGASAAAALLNYDFDIRPECMNQIISFVEKKIFPSHDLKFYSEKTISEDDSDALFDFLSLARSTSNCALLLAEIEKIQTKPNEEIQNKRALSGGIIKFFQMLQKMLFQEIRSDGDWNERTMVLEKMRRF